MKFTSLFSRWIDSNAKPANTQETTALLDEARSTILDITRRVESGEIAMVSPSALTPLKSSPTGTIYNRRAIENANKPPATAAASKPLPSPQATKPAPSPQATRPALTGLAKTSAAFAAQKSKDAKPLPSPHPAPAQPREVSAAEFSGPRLRMSRQEFEKLRPSEQKRFADEGGRIA
jgi:hypothetical protein